MQTYSYEMCGKTELDTGGFELLRVSCLSAISLLSDVCCVNGEANLKK